MCSRRVSARSRRSPGRLAKGSPNPPPTTGRWHGAGWAGFAAAYPGDRHGMELIDRNELATRLQDGAAVVLDVRPSAEFVAGHIAGARSVPIGELRQHLKALPKSAEVVAYCRGAYCVYAGDAVRELCKRGFNAKRLE